MPTRRPRSTPIRYAVAIIATLVAFGLRFLLGYWLESASPFLLFALATMVGAWYGGMGPGLLATLAGAVLGIYFLPEPWDALIGDVQAVSRASVFVLVGSQISWLSGRMYAARDNLEARVAERTAQLHFQKTLLESQNEASRDGIVAVDNGGKVIFANRRFNEIWRLPTGATSQTADDVRKALQAELLGAEDPLSTDEAGRIARGDDQARRQLLLRDGRAVELYSAPIVDPEATNYGRVWFFRDVTEQRHLQRQITEAGEHERRRIGQDLHDDLCQQLTGIACIGQLLQQRLARGENGRDTAREAERIVALVQKANERARDLARGLQPVTLQRHGLPTALQDLCSSVEQMFGVSCRFRGDDRVQHVPDDVATQLYRIAQEAMSNAVRHGRAGQVLVDIVSVGGRLIMTIEDDGVGIPDIAPTTGLGLQTMEYRARMVGGSLGVERGRPGGTVVTCTLTASAPPSPASGGVAEGGTSGVQR